MASHYVPGEGRLNLIAPRRTCRGQRDILRGTPLRPCWGCKSGSTRHCCTGPCSAFAAAHKFYQLAALLAETTKHSYFPEIFSIYSTKFWKGNESRNNTERTSKKSKHFCDLFFFLVVFFSNAKHGDIMFTSSMCCKIALVKHLVWQKCRGGDAEPRNVSPS